MTPKLEELIAAIRAECGFTFSSRVGRALMAYDESVKPNPIDGYLYWDEEDGLDDAYFNRNSPTPTGWDNVLKGTFVPEERIR